MPERIRILLVDDEVLVRQALSALLALNDDFELVAEAANGEQAVSLANLHQPQVVLMDIQMPVMDGVAATSAIRQTLPGTAVLVLTTYDDEVLILEAIKNGASGYLLKDSGSERIASAVRAISKGYTAIDEKVMPKIISNIMPERPTPGVVMQPRHSHATSLTDRQLEVLKLLKGGSSNVDIARTLGITEKTVRDHIVNILAQLNLRDRTQAALWASKNLP